MATKAEKQELIDVLKFTPTKVQILIQGYGGETYAGHVDRKIYDYFRAQKIDIEEYASSWDEFENMPKEMMPFSPGSPFDCDNIYHASGAELSNLNSITVYETDSGKEIWDYNMGWSELEEAGVTVEEFSNTDLDELEEGEVVFSGGQGEKGCFFDGEVTLTAPFDPKKLKVMFENCNGWYIVNYIEYDGEDVDGSGGYSTTGKWAEHKWVLGGNEEVYDDVVPVDEREDEGLTWDSVSEDTREKKEVIPPMPELPKTDWYPAHVKPVYKGEYEVDLGPSVVWPFTRIIRAEWTGRTWKNDEGKKLSEHVAWRGLAVDPNAKVEFDWSDPDYTCVQCDWVGTVDEANADDEGNLTCPECGEPVEMKE